MQRAKRRSRDAFYYGNGFNVESSSEKKNREFAEELHALSNGKNLMSLNIIDNMKRIQDISADLE